MKSEVTLKNTVLISNSIPKSGSTILYVLQRAALNLAAGKTSFNYDDLNKRGIQVIGGFIENPNSPEFLKYLRDGQIDGPIVVKTHALIGKELRDLFEDMPNLFISLSVRDPLDILFSAQSNFKRTGEFKEFEDLEQGCKTINGFFRDIYTSTLAASRIRPIPIVRYADVIRDRGAAVVESFTEELRALAPLSVVSQVVGVHEVETHAAERLDVGKEVRDTSHIDAVLLEGIKKKLHDFRHLLGYTD